MLAFGENIFLEEMREDGSKTDHCAEMEPASPSNASEHRGTCSGTLLLLQQHSSHHPDQIPQQLLAQSLLHPGCRHRVGQNLQAHITRRMVYVIKDFAYHAHTLKSNQIHT